MPENKSAPPPDPLLGCRFHVEFGKEIQAGFTEVSGLSVEIETETYKEGGENRFEHILPKNAKYEKIVLKKGVIDKDNNMWNWFQGTLEGKMKPKNLAILLLDPDPEGSAACRWEVENALPVKWEGSNLSGKSGEIFLETLTLVHQGLKKV